MPHPIVVVGGSLAGMAAAGRLAKAGHRVVLFERTERLGGYFDDATLPPIFTLPAPWRDLFRKTGRAFDVELARSGHALVPAPPARHLFADGSDLTLPTDRGDQWSALGERYGRPAATRWRDLLDSLDDQWQVLRRLGLEDEAPDGALTTARRLRLRARTSVADLAAGIGEPHLAEVILDTARRIGSRPDRTPGWVAVRLSVERTFGRWLMQHDGVPVPAGTLIDLLGARLATRKVDVRLGIEVTRIEAYRVHTGRTSQPAAAIVSGVDPWAFARLAHQDRGLRSRLRWARPATAPLVTDSLRTDDPTLSETVSHTPRGPVVTYRLPGPNGVRVVTHDHTVGTPEPGFGVAWNGWRTWRRLPPSRAATPMTLITGSGSRAGGDPWAQLLSGALACYAAHELLTGEDLRPTNRSRRVG